MVATLLPNGVEMFELYLAALQAGWYLVPINHHLIGAEVAYILKDSDAKVFVAHERFADVALDAAEEAELPSSICFAVGDIPGFGSYARMRDAQPTTDPADRTIGDVMNYTSGTTGNPKGVFRKLSGLSPEEAALGQSGILFLFGIQPQDDNVHIVGSPLYHTAVMRFSGASIHLGPHHRGHGQVAARGDAPAHPAVPGDHLPHGAHPVPPPPGPARGDPGPLRRVVAAAHDPRRGPVPGRRQAPDDRLVGRRHRRVLRGVRGRRHPGHRPGVADQARDRRQGVADQEIAIFDDEGNKIEEPNVIGTVYMSMQTGDFEYHKDEKKTKSNRIGKYFTVGDVGLIDEDGYLFLRDRKIDMIISGGANIYPAEIENVLLGFPKVGDVAVFGIPHDDWGEEIKAVIEPAEGVEPSDELAAEILEYCSTRLAKFKTPKSIDFTDSMPRDPNGKLYKRKLRDPYWEGREKI